MLEVGRLCVKTAGRDAGKRVVVVESLDKKYVLIDGEGRRKKCNLMHLEPLDKVVALKKGASHDEVERELKKIGIAVRRTKPKPAKEKPKRQRKSVQQHEKPEQGEIKKEKKAQKAEKKDGRSKK